MMASTSILIGSKRPDEALGWRDGRFSRDVCKVLNTLSSRHGRRRKWSSIVPEIETRWFTAWSNDKVAWFFAGKIRTEGSGSSNQGRLGRGKPDFNVASLASCDWRFRMHVDAASEIFQLSATMLTPESAHFTRFAKSCY